MPGHKQESLRQWATAHKASLVIFSWPTNTNKQRKTEKPKRNEVNLLHSTFVLAPTNSSHLMGK